MERSAGKRGPGEVARLGLERPAVPPRPEMNTVKLQSSSMHHWNRRGARWALALALLACAPLAAEVRSLTILHTNDLHARLSPREPRRRAFAYVAAAIRRERAHCNDCILLNAGDLVQGSPVSTIFHGLPVY